MFHPSTIAQPWHLPCFLLERMETLRLARLRVVSAFSWKLIAVLAAVGVTLGFVLALTLSFPVS
jgi:hypothetical protein